MKPAAERLSASASLKASPYRNQVPLAAEAIKVVDASLRVGGPATARDEWIDEFLDFCDTVRAPVDYVSHAVHAPYDIEQTGARGIDTAIDDTDAARQQTSPEEKRGRRKITGHSNINRA